MAQRRFRVTFVLASATPDGAELAVSTLLAHRPGWVEPEVLFLSDGPLVQRIQDAGVPVRGLSLGSRKLPELAQLEYRMFRAVARSRPDLVCAVGNKAVLLTLPATTMLRGSLAWYKVDLVMPRRQVALVSRLCKRVIAMSRAAGAGVPDAQLRVAHPPVRLAESFRVSERRPPATLTCLGRLEPTKGQHDLIEAAGAVCRRFPDLKVVLAGAEPPYASGYRASLTEAAIRLGIRLELLGAVDRIEPALEATTVYVQPSYRDAGGRGGEGFGIALAEAAWAGLPAIASRTGGTPEVVQDGITGILVEPRNPAALAGAIERLLTSHEEARTMGIVAASRARALFSPDKGAERFFSALYDGVRE